jgi:hypothetical protein
VQNAQIKSHHKSEERGGAEEHVGLVACCPGGGFFIFWRGGGGAGALVIDSIATAGGWRATIFPALAVYVCDPMPTPERFISSFPWSSANINVSNKTKAPQLGS